MKSGLQLLKNQPLTTVLLVATNIALLLWSYSSFELWQRDSVLSQDLLARELATTSTLTLSTAMIANDRASLQATLAELTEQEQIVRARVQDVEQNLLAQAGAPSNAATRSFSAPIALQDTIAGFLTLDIASTQEVLNQHHRWRWLTISIALLLCALGVLLNRARRAAPSPADTAPVETAPGTTGTQRPLVLLIHCRNLEALQQQLDAPSVQLLFNKLQSWLEHSAKLYQGGDCQLLGDIIAIRFPADPFNALCCSQLLFTFSRRFGQRWLPGVQLQMAGLLHSHSHSLEEQLSATHQVRQVPLNTVAVAADIAVDERFEKQHNTQGITFVTSPAARYTELLASQTQQLNSAIG